MTTFQAAQMNDLAVLVDHNAPKQIEGSTHPTVIAANRMLEETGVTETMSSSGIDLEDWAEAVCRYAGAASFAHRHRLPVTTTLGETGRLIDLRAHRTRAELFAERHATLISAPRSTRYATAPSFLRHAARKIVICRNDAEASGFASYPTLDEGMAIASTWGAEELCWKQATGPDKAYPVAFIANNRRLPPDIGLNAYSAGGLSMLQERVEMTFETRYFVVDREIVSGAGAVEAHTPFDRRPETTIGATHAIFERRRNVGPAAFDGGVARRLDDAAPAIAREIAFDLGVNDFTLDLFVNGATDEIGVVETNPITASGFYANAGFSIFSKLGKALLRSALATV